MFEVLEGEDYRPIIAIGVGTYELYECYLLSNGQRLEPSQDNDTDEVLSTELTLVTPGGKVPLNVAELPEDSYELLLEMISPT